VPSEATAPAHATDAVAVAAIDAVWLCEPEPVADPERLCDRDAGCESDAVRVPEAVRVDDLVVSAGLAVGLCEPLGVAAPLPDVLLDDELLAETLRLALVERDDERLSEGDREGDCETVSVRLPVDLRLE
jgi:hypothetical protein